MKNVVRKNNELPVPHSSLLIPICSSFLIFFLLFFPLQNIPAQGPSAEREAGLVDTEFLWRQALGGTIIGRPAVQARLVVTVIDGGTVRAYSASGRSLWTFSARGRLSPFITLSREGTSYICRTNGIFIALNRIGRELWRVNIGGPLSGPVVLGWDGRVFIPTENKISCYTASGNLLWSRGIEGRINTGPLRDQGGGILLALDNGTILRIDHFGRASGVQLSSSPRLLLSVKRNVSADITSPNQTVLALHANGDAQLIDIAAEASGSTVFNLPGLPCGPLAGAVRGGNAALVLADGRVILLSGADGNVLWTADSHIRVQGERGGGFDNDAAVIFDNRGIYVQSVNGATGFSGDGRRLWFTILRNASGVPAFDDEGVLYSGGKDWILYAWKLEERALPQKQTLYGPAPEGSYGTGHPPPPAYAGFSGVFDDFFLREELETIRKEIQAGRVGENELEWLSRLMETAAGGIRLGNPLSLPRIQSGQRIQALHLLSLIGSTETIPWLVRFFNREIDPVVKAAAARAIGGIGVDPDGIAMKAFLAAVTVLRPEQNEQVFISVAAATGSLCRFSGPPLIETGAKILVMLSDPNQPSAVQRQACLELERLISE